jgi:DNA-binding transcriptional MerR regulator
VATSGGAGGSGDDVLEPVAQPAGPPGDTVGVTAAARRIGVAAATLRSWERRYGLGPSGHVPGAHRRYTEEDLARLGRMRALTVEGIAPAEAARLAASPPERRAARRGRDDAPPAARSLLHRRRADRAGAAAGRSGGGGAVPAAAASRGLRRAALALDAAVCDEVLAASLRSRGALATWQDVVAPALAALGERWRLTGVGVDAEHLLSDAAQSLLRAVAVRGAREAATRPVLLAGVPDELHALPLYALAAALAERGIATRTIGASVPWPVLGAAISRTGPPAVFLWSQRPATADLAGVAGLPAIRPPARIVLCGPGWTGRTLPPGLDATLADDLVSAVAYGVWASGG